MRGPSMTPSEGWRRPRYPMAPKSAHGPVPAGGGKDRLAQPARGPAHGLIALAQAALGGGLEDAASHMEGSQDLVDQGQPPGQPVGREPVVAYGAAGDRLIGQRD